MTVRNKYVIRSRISEKKCREIIRYPTILIGWKGYNEMKTVAKRSTESVDF